MYRPVLVSPPEILPVSLAEAKEQLRVDVEDDDALILRMLRTAVAHLDGWGGILGQCLVEQQWRQDFDCFGSRMRLPLGPVISIDSIKWRNTAGVETTIAMLNYALRVDAGGRSHVRFVDAFAYPSDLAETGAVSVLYTAGYPTIPEVPADGDTPAVPAQSTVPDDLKGAIMFHVGHLYENREAVNIGNLSTLLPLGYDSLVEKHRRIGV
ncbi:head-tail connector protein [Mesorhizobium sp. YC-39]|uniref:head-tail connector protein n=1 Tax=unclassified Mesorhizobium TaxID=325217 RepID=UPI0021E72DA4|nr:MULTISPECIES: head-tail connector protein [unclassified Mesorhizobium]MCV3209608.1 head-tail connector protein [Mesorhizobium sp. YC-2]MCV3230138.1 head-tail connector protein [Mesorhizobium sp. YC-39]